MKKRIVALFIIVALVISVPLLGVSAQKTIKGVALGDSVPAFYGVDEEDGYVAQLSELLKAKKIPNDFTNLAVSGLNTQTLLVQLSQEEQLNQTYGDKVWEAIKGADIITLNIGGNNILTPFIEMMINDLKALKITDITKASPVVLMAFAGKKLTEKQISSLMKGVTQFNEDFPEIIEILHKAAPNAEIYVNTVYNPIPSMLGIYEASEILIPLINDYIIENAEELGYTVVDIYSVFKESTDIITNFSIVSGSVDIHPNAAGHALIAEAVNAEMTKKAVADDVANKAKK